MAQATKVQRTTKTINLNTTTADLQAEGSSFMDFIRDGNHVVSAKLASFFQFNANFLIKN
jgi:hypothetical protein